MESKITQKSVVSNYITDALIYDFLEVKNISETRVIKNLCKTYKISYSTFIRWYKSTQKINAKSKSIIDKAVVENFGRCLCYKDENIGMKIFDVLSNPSNKVIFDVNYQTYKDLEDSIKVLENMIEIGDQIQKAVLFSKKENKDISAKNKIEKLQELLNLCIDIKNLLKNHNINLYIGKVPHYKIQNESFNYKNNSVFLFLLADSKKNCLSHLPNINKII